MVQVMNVILFHLKIFFLIFVGKNIPFFYQFESLYFRFMEKAIFVATVFQYQLLVDRENVRQYPLVIYSIVINSQQVYPYRWNLYGKLISYFVNS